MHLSPGSHKAKRASIHALHRGEVYLRSEPQDFLFPRYAACHLSLLVWELGGDVNDNPTKESRAARQMPHIELSIAE